MLWSPLLLSSVDKVCHPPENERDRAHVLNWVGVALDTVSPYSREINLLELEASAEQPGPARVADHAGIG